MVGFDFGLIGLPIIPKIEVVTYYLTKPQYSYEQASITCFVNHGRRTKIAKMAKNLESSDNVIVWIKRYKPIWNPLIIGVINILQNLKLT